ncbi:MAG TPA: DUF3999 family protein [Thermoanaerobaculia bacterium]|nr:DUF3999 family protein [Thermoanaerobaculia bacterium]
MIARAVAILAALVAAGAAAAPVYERRIDVETPGPQRLDVDLALLGGAAAGLADLRIYDRAGREAPYLLVPPAASGPQWTRTRRFEIVPTKTSSGVEADAGARRAIDALRIENVAAPFLKRVRVEGSGDRHRWTLLADTTVFDLPAEGLRRTVIEFDPVEIRYLRLTWDDSSSARIQGVARIVVRAHRSAVPPTPLRSEVSVARRPSEPGRSRFRIDLPAAELPLIAVDILVSAGDVFRQATVSEPRLAGSEILPVVLGSGQLRQAERDGLFASATRIPISSPLSQELEVVIEDGSNPPLQITRAVLELAPQPWIFFEAPSAGAFTARYGDPSLRAPQYDLEAARSFVGRSRPATARWQPVTASTAAVRAAASAPLPAVGAPIDRSEFAISRRIAPAPPGMSILPLDADVLARSRELADVRLVDTTGRQVPFIVQHRDEPLVVPISVGPRREEKGNVSLYALKLPYATPPSGTRLIITTSPGVFEREVRLQAAGEDREPRVLASSTWRHADPDRDPPPLTVNLPRRTGRELELRIAEGDNATLPITAARLLFPSFALRFHHPGTPLTLIYGNPKATAPRYDLALLAPRIFREPAQQVEVTAAGIGGDSILGSIERRFFWIAIAVVALGLMLLLARLLGPLAQGGKPAE